MDLNLVVMICLLGAARCSAGDGPCPCRQIPPRPLTLPPSSQQCFNIGARFRYSCTEGYVRKAGTSSLTVCETKNGVTSWRNASLECIPDPNRRTTTTTQPNTTQGNGVIISSTVTPSSNLPMTKSIYIPATVTLQTESRKPTSPGQQVLPDMTIELDRTTPPSTTPPSSTPPSSTPPSSTPAPSCEPTVNARVSNLSQSTAVGLAAASLVIICVCVGLSCFFYKRRRRINIPAHTNEEAMCMTGHVTSIPATTATVGL